MTATALLIRPATPADLPAITAVYGWNVLNGTGTFELEAPDLAEMTRRHADVTGKGLPWLVAERAGQVLGYAYANHFRPRRAYRFCLEDSIYLLPELQGQGAGRLLLAELMARCEAAGTRQMLAVIGDSANLGSIGVHRAHHHRRDRRRGLGAARLGRALGFEQVGLMKSSGWKFERWLDVVIMQKSLGQGDATSPAEGE
jgi:L-amino acid N-acyltransferase YncA